MSSMKNIKPNSLRVTSITPLNKGVVISLLWTLSDELFKKTKSKKAEKLAKTLLFEYKKISPSMYDEIHRIKLLAWDSLADECKDAPNINIPVSIENIFMENYTPLHRSNKHIYPLIQDVVGEYVKNSGNENLAASYNTSGRLNEIISRLTDTKKE